MSSCHAFLAALIRSSTLADGSPCFSGAVVSVFTGGAFCGAAVAGLSANRLGRRWTIILGASVFCIGGALQASAQNLGYLYGGRVVAGLGVGILVMIIPLYQAEIAHPAIRGRLTGLQQLFIGLGATTAGMCRPFSPPSLACERVT